MDWEFGRVVKTHRDCEIIHQGHYYVMRQLDAMHLCRIEGGFEWSRDFSRHAEFGSIYESEEAIDWVLNQERFR